MKEFVIPAIFTLAGAIVAALGAYFVARRNNSGSVNTADAKTIFEEGNRLREAYKAEAEERRLEIIELRAQIDILNSEIRRLKAELEMLRHTADQLREDADEWRKAALEEAKRRERKET